MNTSYSEPVATIQSDRFVPVQDFVQLLMVWTMRSMNVAKDGFTTLSYSIQFDGREYSVVELVDGSIPQDFYLGKSFTDKDEALAYWGRCLRDAVPPCTQRCLPGLAKFMPDFIETYSYFKGFGGAPCDQSHARIGSWS